MYCSSRAALVPSVAGSVLAVVTATGWPILMETGVSAVPAAEVTERMHSWTLTGGSVAETPLKATHHCLSRATRLAGGSISIKVAPAGPVVVKAPVPTAIADFVAENNMPTVFLPVCVIGCDAWPMRRDG